MFSNCYQDGYGCQETSTIYLQDSDLPLPLEETLKKLPEPHQPLADTSELYILLRSIPTKAKIIWQDLVDVHKVYRALQKLKQINHLYSAIDMPGQPHELHLETQIEEFSATSESSKLLKMKRLLCMNNTPSMHFMHRKSHRTISVA